MPDTTRVAYGMHPEQATRQARPSSDVDTGVEPQTNRGPGLISDFRNRGEVDAGLEVMTMA